MRRFFRFSIRDLLWLTLAVGVGLGWWIDRYRLRAQLQADVDRATQSATKWQMAANAVGRALTDDDCTISINMESSEVIVSFLRTGGRRVFSVDLANAPTVYEIIDHN